MAGWRLVFRQKLPTPEKPLQGGYFARDELRKNADKPEADLFSILDELESFRGSARGDFELKIAYPSNKDVADLIFVQQGNPVTQRASASGAPPVEFVYSARGNPVAKSAHSWVLV